MQDHAERDGPVYCVKGNKWPKADGLVCAEPVGKLPFSSVT